MRLCKKCVTPDTRPHIYFDENGICDACNTAQRKHSTENGIDWKSRLQEFEGLLNKYRSSDSSKYDCVVPVSGGKDSIYQTHVLKIDYKMNPLAVTFGQCKITENGRKNLDALSEIGVDHINFRLNPKVYKILSKEGFVRLGDNQWPCHIGITTTPVQVAYKFKIPLVVYGENSEMEYGGPEFFRDRKVMDNKFREEFCFLGCRPEAIIKGTNLTLEDMKFTVFPSEEELKNSDVNTIRLGYFIKWDSKRNLSISQKYGFSPHPHGPYSGSYWDFENVDCSFIEIHDYMMFIKFGFGRASTQCSIDIRNNVLERNKAIEIVLNLDGKISEETINSFCEWCELSKKDFFKTVDSFANKRILEKKNDRWIRKEEIINHIYK